MLVPVLRSGVTRVTLLKHTGANITKLGEQVFSAIDPKNIKQLHSKNISIPKYKNTPFRINLYVFFPASISFARIGFHSFRQISHEEFCFLQYPLHFCICHNSSGFYKHPQDDVTSIGSMRIEKGEL